MLIIFISGVDRWIGHVIVDSIGLVLLILEGFVDLLEVKAGGVREVDGKD